MIQMDSVEPQASLGPGATEDREVARTRPRVLVLATTFYPKVNGTTTAVADLVAGLQASGHRVHLITRRLPRTQRIEDYKGVEVERVGPGGASYFARVVLFLAILTAALRYLRRHKVNVIQTNGFVSLWVAITVGEIFSTPVVATFHGLHRLWLQDARWRSATELSFSYPLERFAISRADRIIAQSKMLREVISNLYGVGTAKIAVVPHMASPDFFRQPNLARTNNILFVGTLGRVYGVETLLRSAPRILNKLGDARFVIVGTGPLKDELQKLAVELRIAHSVDFVGRVTDRKRLAELYANAALIVIPLRYPGYILSKVAVEGMASGLPVVTTMTLNEEVQRSGVLTTGGSPEEFADGILSVLLADTDSYHNLRLAAYEYAMTHCSSEAMISAIDRVYSEATQGRIAR